MGVRALQFPGSCAVDPCYPETRPRTPQQEQDILAIPNSTPLLLGVNLKKTFHVNDLAGRILSKPLMKETTQSISDSTSSKEHKFELD